MKIKPPIAPYCFVLVFKTFATVGFVIGSVDPSDPRVTGVPDGGVPVGGDPAPTAPGEGGVPGGAVVMFSVCLHSAVKLAPEKFAPAKFCIHAWIVGHVC